MSSLFTKIVNREIPAHIVAENDQFLAFLDVFPLRRGHVLVIPKREEDNIFDLTDTEMGELMIFAKSVAKTIQDKFPCKKVGMAVVGLEVPHAHVHLIPINEVSDMDFKQEKLKLTNEELLQIADNLRK
ncbi:MAG: HIT family protein [Bacteroidetes bacterium]|nr:HIT family protein [Bacteroidota bacterium]